MKLKSTLVFLLTCFIITFHHHFAGAQNLVPNNGFEVQDTCPLVSQITLAQSWSSPSLGTPDLFNSDCATQNVSAHTGHGSSGVFTLVTFPDYREYIQARLLAPLNEAQSYCVSFWVKRSNFRYATNRMGVYFSTDSIYETNTDPLPFVPQVDNLTSNMLSSTGWIQISGSFVANGGERYIIVGSFASDAETDTLVANSGSTSNVAFYQIDDITVSICTGIDDPGVGNNIKVFPTPASDQLHVRLEKGMPGVRLELINAQGQIIQLADPVELEDGDFVLNVENQTPGLYMLMIRSGDMQVSKKVLISR